ncbi:glycine dehydrogenase [Trypanosoma cruzi]|nr:glycine dehydrogenase [Trypanosoma cruzi]
MYRCFHHFSTLPLAFVRRTATNSYVNRHIGPSAAESISMLRIIGKESLSERMTAVIPENILRSPLKEVPAMSEQDALSLLHSLGSRNKVLRSMIGQGYYEPGHTTCNTS